MRKITGEDGIPYIYYGQLISSTSIPCGAGIKITKDFTIYEGYWLDGVYIILSFNFLIILNVPRSWKNNFS